MLDASIKDRLLEYLETLPYDSQRRVLDFAQALAQTVPKGVAGKHLLRWAGAVPPDDLRLMEQAIQESCEKKESG